MKFDHETSWFYKYPDEKFSVEYSFVDVLDSGDAITSFTASIYNQRNEDKSASMITGKVVLSPAVYFTVHDGSANETYNIKLTGTTAPGGSKYTYYLTCEIFGYAPFNTKLADRNSNSYVTLEEANEYIRSKYGHNSKWDSLSDEGKKWMLVEAAREIDMFNFTGEKYYSSQSMQFPRNTHTVVTGNCATPLSLSSFKSTRVISSTYGKYPTDYWKYGTCHITSGTPVYDIRNIDSSNAVTGVITILNDFSATPTENTGFRIFEPLHREIKFAQCEQVVSLIDNSDLKTLQNYRNLSAESVTIGEVSVRWGSGGSGAGSGSTIGPIISSSAKRYLSRFIRKGVRIGRG